MSILIGVAAGIIVPVILLVGPYLPYLRPERRRMHRPEENQFAETFMAALKGDEQ